MRLRVLVYNVRGFRDGLDPIVHLAGRFRPDVILLNETGMRMRLRRFAGALGMDVAADPWSPLRRRVKDAVLAHAPWRVVEHRLHRFAGGSVLYPRGALIATIASDADRVTAVATHLGLHPAERRRHAQELTEVLRDVDGPVILGGDLNEPPGGHAARLLASHRGDAWLLGGDAPGETYPARAPTARIDYLFVSEGIRVERALVPGDEGAATGSDHRPLVAELTLPKRG